MRVLTTGPSRHAHGFSMVEATVGFAVFLIVAAFITWSLSSMYATAAQQDTRAHTSAAISTQLTILANTPTTDLIAGNFTVPSPCPNTNPGIDGHSCVQLPGTTAQIAYQFIEPGHAPPTCPANSANPSDLLDQYGYLQIQGCLVAATATAFTDLNTTDTFTHVPTQTRTITPDTPGQRATVRTVVVHLDGETAALGDRPVLLQDLADITFVHGSATVDRGTVTFTLPDTSTAAMCTTAYPCTLGLSTGTPHTRTIESTNPNDPVVDITPDLGPGTQVSAPNRSTTHLHATLSTTAGAPADPEGEGDGYTSPPETITGLAANPASEGVQVTWDVPDRAVSYTLTRQTRTAPAPTLSAPRYLTVAADGTVYIADTTNHRIRAVTPTGAVTTIAGSTAGLADGVGTAAQFNAPSGIDIDPAGNLYVADTGNHVIRKITPAGQVTTIAGSTSGYADGVGAAAKFLYPWDVAYHGNTLFISDYGNHRIRKLDVPSGSVVTVSGVGGPAGGTGGMVDGTREASRFSFPTGISIGAGGTLYVADTGNHRIRTVSLVTGAAGTLAGSTAGLVDGVGTSALFDGPRDVGYTDGYVYVADALNHRLRRVDATTGQVSTVSGQAAGFVDGDALTARLNQPWGLATTPTGLYVTDVVNHAVRWFDPSTTNLSTVLGTGYVGATDNPAGFSTPEVIYTGPDPHYLDTTTTPGATYRYTLTADNSAGTSPTAGPVTARP